MPVNVYALCIKDELELSIFPYLRYFSFKRQQNIQKYRRREDQNRTVWAELLARYLLCNIIPAKWSEIFIERDKNGKPYVKALEYEWKISLSHSGAWVLCSIGRCDNGVDVEIETADFEEISRYYFSPEEFSTLQAMPLSCRKKAFLCYWTIKESYLKYTGEGLSKDLSEIDCAAILKGTETISGKNFFLSDGSVVGICTEKNYLPTDIKLILSDEIKKFLTTLD